MRLPAAAAALAVRFMASSPCSLLMTRDAPGGAQRNPCACPRRRAAEPSANPRSRIASAAPSTNGSHSDGPLRSWPGLICEPLCRPSASRPAALGMALQQPSSTRDNAGKCGTVHASQPDRMTAEHQVTGQKSLPEPTHRHPDKEEVGSSSLPRTASQRVGEPHSARNRFSGLISRVTRDTVMAQVEIQAGPHRIVSLLSREAADELGLEPGMLAVAAVKATNVSVEIPKNN
jgi:molybdopterin-binding protein